MKIMKRRSIFSIITFVLVFLFHYSAATDNTQGTSKGWKAGVAKVLITPEQSMWMAGYGARNHESEGTLVDLWAKALALEDASGNQPIMILGGELVIEYAIKLKQIFGLNTYVIGYSNDLMSYIPSTTIIKEGGYEGASSQRGYGLPGVWSETIETLILQEMIKLTEQVGISQSITE